MKMPDYTCKLTNINGVDIAIMQDLNMGSISLTNSIDEVAKKENVANIVYLDSMNIWDFWNKEDGFKTLAVNGVATTNLEIALEQVKKYL